MTAKKSGTCLLCMSLLFAVGRNPAFADIQTILTLKYDAVLEQPSLSADGRYIAWQTSATNLVPDDLNKCGNGDYSKAGSCPDIFLFDRLLGTFERVSVADDESEAQFDQFGFNGSAHPVITPDARYVAFRSDANNLVPGDTNHKADIFLRDRQLGTTELVSVADDESLANGDSQTPAISSDGRYVAFHSLATNLVPGVGTSCSSCGHIYLRDRTLGTTELISRSAAGDPGNGASEGQQAMSADGRFVAYGSRASNLVSGDTNDGPDIFVLDRMMNTVERVSVDSGGNEAHTDSMGGGTPGISANGRFVVYFIGYSDLVAGDTNNVIDVFLHDRDLHTTERVSVNSDEIEADDHAGMNRPVVSNDGRFVFFESRASNLDPAGGNTWIPPGDTMAIPVIHVFVRDRTLGTTTRLSVNDLGEMADGNCVTPAIDEGAQNVAFTSEATNLSAPAPSTLPVSDVATRAAVKRSRSLVVSADCSAAVCGDGEPVPFCEECDDGNMIYGDGCTPACEREQFKGQSLVLKANADASKRRLKMSSADRTLRAGDALSDADPVLYGGSLRIVSDASGFDTVFSLPSAGWSYVGNPADGRGFRYADRLGASGPVTMLKMSDGKLKVAAAGSGLAHTLASNPAPVQAVLNTGTAYYCFEFGGTVKFKAGKSFTAKSAPTPMSCP